jgi:phosphoglucosamine mutase
VKDKMEVINSQELKATMDKIEKNIGRDYRLMVRVSGTENKIRIMVEGLEEEKCLYYAKDIESTIEKINKMKGNI